MNFVIFTDTPVRMRDFLLAHGVIQYDDSGTLVGTNPGLEWVRMDNQVKTDPGSGTPGQPGYVPPTYDTRAAFMVKFVRDAEGAEADGPATEIDPATGDPKQSNPFDNTKFGKWIKANSTLQTAPAGWTIGDQPVGDAYKINGQNVWVVPDRAERFGVWQ